VNPFHYSPSKALYPNDNAKTFFAEAISISAISKQAKDLHSMQTIAAH
jgi:hypothetical protein